MDYPLFSFPVDPTFLFGLISELVTTCILFGNKALIVSLKADILAMIRSLSNLGVELSVNLEDLNKADLLPC